MLPTHKDACAKRVTEQIKKADLDPELKTLVLKIRKFSFSNRIDLSQIIKDKISEVLNVEWSNLLTKSRKRELVETRRIAAWCLRCLVPISLEEVAENIGRDHSTVLYHTKYIFDDLSSEVYGKADTKMIIRKIVSEVDKEMDFKSFMQKDVSDELYKKALAIVNRYLCQI